MRCQVIQIVEKYIDAVRRNDASALPLHPDAVCEFSTNTYRGAASFRQGLDQFARILKSATGGRGLLASTEKTLPRPRVVARLLKSATGGRGLLASTEKTLPRPRVVARLLKS